MVSIYTSGPTNGLSAGTARCLGNFFTGAYWTDVIANECIDETPIDGFNNVTWGTSPFTNKLNQMAKVTIYEYSTYSLVIQRSDERILHFIDTYRYLT